MERETIVQVSFILFLFFVGVPKSLAQNNETSNNSKHFVLVHGACLGAWSWYKLVPLLQSSGHRVTAIDLAASGINLVHYNDIQSFSNYSQPLMDLMTSIPAQERVILVGHSLGGASISQAMELFPEKVAVAVFLTAAMPGPSFNLSTILNRVFGEVGSALDNRFIFDNGPNNPPTAFIFGPNYTSQVLYQRSPPQDAALAKLLIRPLALVSGAELSFSEARYGSVSRVFIIVEQDQVVTAEFQNWMIENNPPTRVEKIGGSDHMVMISQPTQLLAHLLGIARDFS